VGDLTGPISNFYPMNSFISVSLRQETRKNINTNYEEIRRKRASLCEISLRLKSFGRGAINKERKCDSGNTLYYGVDKKLRKSHSCHSSL